MMVGDRIQQQMEENFQVQLDTLNENFFSERDNMTQKHDGLKKDIAKMIEIMKEYFDDELNVKRRAHELVLEDLKNQSKEEYNILIIQGEQKIEKTKKHLDETHQEFIERSKPKEEEYLALQKKDMATTRTIEKRLQMLIQIYAQIHYTRSMLITKGKEWESANKSISNEKLELLTHFIKLKRSLGKATNMSHEDLKRTSTSVYQASEALKKVLTFVRKLQSLAGLNQKLETEHEMIFPFNPLYVASVPTAPLESLEKELAQENKCDIHGSPPKEKWEQLADDVVRGEPVPGEVVPKEEKRFQVDMKISYPIDKPFILNPPPKPPSYHWASFAVDDNGLEIAELDYLQNFQKRYNKVMLDKMALQLERRQLLAENEKLQTGMGKWLDGYMLTEKAKAKPNSMVGVNRCKLKPPPRKPPVIVDIPKRRSPRTEEH